MLMKKKKEGDFVYKSEVSDLNNNNILNLNEEQNTSISNKNLENQKVKENEKKQRNQFMCFECKKICNIIDGFIAFEGNKFCSNICKNNYIEEEKESLKTQKKKNKKNKNKKDNEKDNNENNGVENYKEVKISDKNLYNNDKEKELDENDQKEDDDYDPMDVLE